MHRRFAAWPSGTLLHGSDYDLTVLLQQLFRIFFLQNQLALGHSGQYGQFWTKILIFEHDFLKHPRPIRALDFEFFP